MSYQVLARKWRPRNFHELIGQEHVSRALVNALDQGRLHHAYLFTGTRGVGKTTLARILAKCLNCEEGVSSRPCGVCGTCREIDDGRFVDLIEVDAASRTKVEDTRELLDNVQYAPTQGRYKVYLIDEVHMLSTHSFNALLKTLEEPPPHVKFLLATTDPQKLPVTILSRCLQFTLKNMPPVRVVEHLSDILAREEVSFEKDALWLLGKAADGSMRDAMSLTDQAIAFGHGQVRREDVAAMLGTLDHRHVLALLECLASLDAASLLAEVATLAEQGPDYGGVLDDMASVFHRLAIAQMVPSALDNGHGDRDALLALASRFTGEDVQLYYQIALQGRGDMANAPDARTALEMTLLRMLAFRPQGVPRPAQTPLPMTGQAEGANAPGAQAPAPVQQAPVPEAPAQPQQAPAAPVAPAPQSAASVAAPATDAQPPMADEPPPWATEDVPQDARDAGFRDVAQDEPQPETAPESAPAPEQTAAPAQAPAAPSSAMSRLSAAFGSAPAQPEAAESPAPQPAEAVPAAPQPAEAVSAAPEAAEAETSAPAQPEPAASPAPEPVVSEPVANEPAVAEQPMPEPAAAAAPSPVPSASSADGRLNHAAWLELFPSLGLGGITRNIGAHCLVEHDDGTHLKLRLDPAQSAMMAEVHQERIRKALAGQGVERVLEISVAPLPEGLETPHSRRIRLLGERHARAVEALRADPHIQSMEQQLGARLIEESVNSFEPDDF
ncbi:MULTISPECIES: DNA polymerase III subunit gamma/tau [unclassified Cobetia]|uniref:DNA polymerase III subunit gamma/tau n=1 Tax=unclassified Cobetia TaxID=2609414 RepID=UPI002098383B|nr:MULTISPECIES: DNA polymerase III subunit gamma/tau [unclassified Cobetia]MCO7231416.1 DNA polymerase III subunit gamma/tau [Cobetia sp. Dlab-2-AX]MCO7234175.1 DNA polymerase III subunit gamma/tau [Cobetia sp. Dlab-2-U]